MKHLIVVALLAIGCSGGHNNRFDVSGLADDRVEMVQNSADTWCKATSGDYCPTLDGGSEDNQVQFVDELIEWHGKRLNGLAICHEADWVKGKPAQAFLYIWTGGSKEFVRLTVLHEIGHVSAECANGFDEPGFVMSEQTLGRGTEPTQDDVEYVTGG